MSRILGVVVAVLALSGCASCGGSGGAAAGLEQPMLAASEGPTRAASTGPTTSTRPVRAGGLEAGWTLAPSATYTARASGGTVTVTARGESSSAGYEVRLVESAPATSPPRFLLTHKRPEGMAAQVITPFEVTASGKVDASVTAVVVEDASGRHDVSVGR